MNIRPEQIDAIKGLPVGRAVPDGKVLEIFPEAREIVVPPKPDHVLYDLRIPAFAGKLVTLGPPQAPLVWFTWCRPRAPLVPPVTGQHWIWIESGPFFWIVDMWFNRQVLSAKAATRLAFDAGIEMGLVRRGEEVLFYRDPQGRKPGRYGRMRVPNSR